MEEAKADPPEPATLSSRVVSVSDSAASPSILDVELSPNADLAVLRAKARLPKDENGNPHKHFGLFAPAVTVRTLGSDAAMYVRIITEGVLVSLIILVIQLPPTFHNMNPGIDYPVEYGP